MNTNISNAQPFCQMLTPEQWEFLSEEPYATIYDLIIRPGEEYAISARNICSYIHASERKLRDYIKTMRRKGLLIMSGNNGYWLPATIEELQRYISQTKSGAIDELCTLKHARQALKEVQNAKTGT